MNKHDIPCGPILSMKEIAEDEALRKTGTIVEVDHPTRGKYLTVGNPIKLSASPSEVKRSPLLGEHTDEILRDVLGYSEDGSRRNRRAPAPSARCRRSPRSDAVLRGRREVTGPSPLARSSPAAKLQRSTLRHTSTFLDPAFQIAARATRE